MRWLMTGKVAMAAYIIRRLLQAIVVVVLVSIGVFLAMRVLPGDPIYMLYSPDKVQLFTDEEIARIKHEAGLDRPLPEQYITWMKGALHGDLGVSILYKTSVSRDIADRLPITLHLGGLAFLLGIVVGVPIGVITAIRRATWIDTLLTAVANLGITVPIFWLGIMLVYVFSLEFKWLPVMGYTSPFDDFSLSVRQLIMPVLCLSIWPIAGNARLVRSTMLEVLRQDYIRTAWSKGLTERVVIVRHALKNGLIPVVTMAGMWVSTIVGGAVLIEKVFNIPGMGRLVVDAIFTQDYAYVQGVTLLITVIVILTNLLVDISYGWLDPRIRYS
jgi:peptide/nickel transport system permease protein